jgi:hypothetical protein
VELRVSALTVHEVLVTLLLDVAQALGTYRIRSISSEERAELDDLIGRLLAMAHAVRQDAKAQTNGRN